MVEGGDGVAGSDKVFDRLIRCCEHRDEPMVVQKAAKLIIADTAGQEQSGSLDRTGRHHDDLTGDREFHRVRRCGCHERHAGARMLSSSVASGSRTIAAFARSGCFPHRRCRAPTLLECKRSHLVIVDRPVDEAGAVGVTADGHRAARRSVRQRGTAFDEQHGLACGSERFGGDPSPGPLPMTIASYPALG
jgi:hypothetical protein